MDDDARSLLIFYIGIAVSIGIGAVIKDWYLSKAGEPLTQRLRELSFLAYLRQASCGVVHVSTPCSAVSLQAL